VLEPYSVTASGSLTTSTTAQGYECIELISSPADPIYASPGPAQADHLTRDRDQSPVPPCARQARILIGKTRPGLARPQRQKRAVMSTPAASGDRGAEPVGDDRIALVPNAVERSKMRCPRT
jgi:hypothetical protein